MRFPSLLSLASQIPLQNHLYPAKGGIQAKGEFVLKEGATVFTPKDLVELPRPGEGVANDAGDLVLVPVSKYTERKKFVLVFFLIEGFGAEVR